ncbi:uncharacterized protein F5147DRAFT_344232 [Suillus discolor]|uniref:Uncharacterized protein n=1 Tax=Suillus discolor TaxID=1912936 RepID=A0A9P7FH19_9AGAM|nr:uncharacterized protein F5147DRAFT_344232 [Suillus discolor]KAG2116418.1 hypothetical protein F5147DRAFT_344232 [Suillus discolor]
MHPFQHRGPIHKRGVLTKVFVLDDLGALHSEVQWTWGRKWGIIRITSTLSRYAPFSGALMSSYYMGHPRLSARSFRTENAFLQPRRTCCSDSVSACSKGLCTSNSDCCKGMECRDANGDGVMICVWD